MHFTISLQTMSPIFGATRIGVRCSVATLVFGSLGMWLGDLLLPLDSGVYHHADWRALILSAMTFGMLICCLPACVFACRHQCMIFGPRSHSLLHIFGKAAMVAGMVAGFLLLPDSHAAVHASGGLPAHGTMIAGMTVGGGLGYAFAFFAITTFNRTLKKT